MARYPKARWRPVVDKGNDPPIIPVGVILHVSGGESTSLFGYFNGPSGGVESHLHLDRAGEWEQYRDTTQEADANYRGNSWIGPDGRRYGFISVETQGGARGEWSPLMLAEIKDFLRWASAEHGFPLRRCSTVQPDSPAEGGVGYHVMFGAGAGTFSWSNAAGKVCPGRDRIRQFDHDLVPWMDAEGDDLDMDRTTFEQYVHNGVLQALRDPQTRAEVERAVWHDTTVYRGGQKIAALQELADAKTQALAARGEIAGLLEAVRTLGAGKGVDLDAVRKAARDGVADALVSIDTTVTVAPAKES